jgi:outer membrane protein assembly factor BamE (lipoprotein component of BamABCDE complex)
MGRVFSILAVATAAVSMAGCSDPHVPSPVFTHFASAVCQDSGPAAARLYQGMSPEAVSAVLGEPARKEAFRYGDLPAETWYYSTDPLNDYVELANGKLMSWRLQRCSPTGA